MPSARSERALANPAYHETLSGAFKDVIDQVEIDLPRIPLTAPMR